ncbi:MAG: PIN domain-containing protein [Eubacterium sp.]|jgi:predicted nucleic acid-binding protein|nr:PIN domain-containing protein [Eubacterium sp.]
MTVLLDTNIILDALQERSPFDIEAKEIVLRAENGEMTCLFTANAAADIFFLYSKARDMKSARAALDFLLKNYGVISVTHEDCNNAMSLFIEDFEDALVVVCAQKVKADYIVTRDEELLLEESPIKLIKPKKMISLLNSKI